MAVAKESGQLGGATPVSLETAQDRHGNTPIHYISGRTPTSAIKALKDFDITDTHDVCVLSTCICTYINYI